MDKPTISVFRGLQALILTGFYCNIDWRVEEIETVLLMSANLRHLHISISMATVRRYLAEGSMKFLYIFTLCHRYEKILPAPLKLRSLVLRDGVISRTVRTASWLFKLEYLEEI